MAYRFLFFKIKFIGNIRPLKAIPVIMFTALVFFIFFNLFFIDKTREVVYNEKNNKILIDLHRHESCAKMNWIKGK